VQSFTTTIKELVKKAIGAIEDYHQRQERSPAWALVSLTSTKMTTGLHAGEMIVIAASRRSEQTSLAMNIAEHVAIDEKLPVGVFSLENDG